MITRTRALEVWLFRHAEARREFGSDATARAAPIEPRSQGALLLQTRSALELVVTSDTQDQAQLAEAFAKLRLFFALEAVMFLLSMGLQCGGFLTQAFAPMSQLHQLGGVS